MKKIFLLFSLLILFLWTIPAQAFYILDDFTVIQGGGEYWSLVPSATPKNTVNSLTKIENGLDVMGGSRFTKVDTNPVWVSYSGYTGWVNGNVSGDVWTGSYDGRDGFLFMSTGSSGWGSMALIYDGSGLGLNLNFSPVSTITIALSPDHVGFGKASSLSITLTDNFSHTATVTKTWNTTQYFSDFFEENFALNQFTGVDLSQIYSLRMNYAGDRSNDVSFDYIATNVAPTPLPGSVLLLGTGLLGFATFTRRK